MILEIVGRVFITNLIQPTFKTSLSSSSLLVLHVMGGGGDKLIGESMSRYRIILIISNGNLRKMNSIPQIYHQIQQRIKLYGAKSITTASSI